MKLNTTFLGLFVLAVFLKGCFFPGWPAVAELIAAGGLVGFVVWLNPNRPIEVTKEEFDKLKQQAAETKEALVGLNMKLGFMRPSQARG